jgi:hypothetical protein
MVICVDYNSQEDL